MKKVVLIALIVTGIIAGSIVVGGFLLKNQDDTSTSSSTNQSSADTSESTSGSESQTPTQTYTTAQVAEHSTENDCWIIISNEVYDVTKFIPQHPGGAERIIPYCGKDATTAFATQGGEGSHSSTAESLKQDYLIGSLE